MSSGSLVPLLLLALLGPLSSCAERPGPAPRRNPQPRHEQRQQQPRLSVTNVGAKGRLSTTTWNYYSATVKNTGGTANGAYVGVYIQSRSGKWIFPKIENLQSSGPVYRLPPIAKNSSTKLNIKTGGIEAGTYTLHVKVLSEPPGGNMLRNLAPLTLASGSGTFTVLR